MDDLSLRLLIVAAAAGAGLVTAWVARRVAASRPYRRVEHSDLGPGVYLFTSATCSTCEPARRLLAERLGAGGFVEMAWEEAPDVFTHLGVDEVPAILQVGASGRARLYPAARRVIDKL